MKRTKRDCHVQTDTSFGADGRHAGSCRSRTNILCKQRIGNHTTSTTPAPLQRNNSRTCSPTTRRPQPIYMCVCGLTVYRKKRGPCWQLKSSLLSPHSAGRSALQRLHRSRMLPMVEIVTTDRPFRPGEQSLKLPRQQSNRHHFPLNEQQLKRWLPFTLRQNTAIALSRKNTVDESSNCVSRLHHVSQHTSHTKKSITHTQHITYCP